MNTHPRRWRSAAALTALVLGAASVATGIGAATAEATPVRSAASSTDTTYLHDALGLSSATVVETVTYDRFQYLLQQSGQFAFLIGDPATDAGFAAQAQAVDAAARTAGVQKIYWFDPNLTGNATLVSGATTTVTPNLDIRNPAGISTITATSQAVYGNAWKNLVAQYLGNGLKATVTGLNTESAKVATAVDSTVVNDTTAPLYDYSTGTPTAALHSTFFIYDKNNTSSGVADKLVQSVDLDADADYATHVAADFTSVGGSTIDAIGQFPFWRDEVNAKELAQSADTVAYGTGTVLDDSDNAQPWAVQQITYPELVHLLNLHESATQNFVILFGGTWCPNTRAVLKDVNANAQQNNVTVYNFDTVLDGGTVGGATTSATNPLQVRNTANNGSGAATANANPSFVYAGVISTYLKNIVTQYELDSANGGGSSYVSYYPNGDTAKPVAAVRKLQVPFLVDYQHGASATPASTGIKRQWIQQNTDVSTGLPYFTEYMSEYYYTRPLTGRIGLTEAKFPTAIATIPGLAGFDWKNPVYPDTTTNSDDGAYLIPSDATALSAALAAVPNSASLSTAADVTAAITQANAATPVDATLVTNLTTINTGWTLAQTRKSNVTNALANVAFGLEAVAKLGTFFDGLPGGVVSTQTVTAPAVVYGTAPSVTVAIANDYGRVPSGTVTLNVAGGTYTQDVAANSTSFTLPVLAPGSYAYSLAYAGDDQILGFAASGSLAVVKYTTSSITASVATAPTQATAGSLVVSVGTPAGLAAATGAASVTISQGAVSSTAVVALSNGSGSVALPKATAGAWNVAVAWAGDSNYPAASSATGFTVGKVAAKKFAGSVTTKPTSKKAGKYKITVTAPVGVATTATGSVVVKVTRAKTSKSITGKLAKGVVTVKLPKLAKGTWKIAVAWKGDANYAAGSFKSSLKIVK